MQFAMGVLCEHADWWMYVVLDRATMVPIMSSRWYMRSLACRLETINSVSPCVVMDAVRPVRRSCHQRIRYVEGAMNGMNGTGGAGPLFYGKYRGKVTDNDDPNGLGRIRVKVQDVLGDEESGRALPATPYAGDGVGLYLIPPVDAFVWVEFEHGDPDYPIWTGCFWGTRDTVPGSGPDIKVLQTDTGTITIDDTDGDSSITIETTSGL